MGIEHSPVFNSDPLFEFNLPVLDSLKPGRYSLGVPEKDGKLQVGLLVPPEAIKRIVVEVGDGVITISREDGALIQIEAPHVLPTEKVILRGDVFRNPVEAVEIRRSVEAGNSRWLLSQTDIDPDMRVGLSRAVAKIGEVIQSRQES